MLRAEEKVQAGKKSIDCNFESKSRWEKLPGKADADGLPHLQRSLVSLWAATLLQPLQQCQLARPCSWVCTLAPLLISLSENKTACQLFMQAERRLYTMG